MGAARKITLGDARDGSAEALAVYCDKAVVGGEGCRHSARLALGPLVERFGPARRLDELPLRCAVCGALGPDVRPVYPSGGATSFATWGMAVDGAGASSPPLAAPDQRRRGAGARPTA
jgi:hypothetical protein